MKTPLTEAIEHFEKQSVAGSNYAYMVAKYLKSLLPKEKEVIVDSFIAGCGYTDPDIQPGEQYYNQTFNQ